MSFASLWKLHEKFGRQLVERLRQDLEGMADSAGKQNKEQQLQRFLAVINCYVNLIRSMARGVPEALAIPGNSCTMRSGCTVKEHATHVLKHDRI